MYKYDLFQVKIGNSKNRLIKKNLIFYEFVLGNHKKSPGGHF